MKTKRPRLNDSGLPRGAVAGFVKGKSCGRGNHRFIVAKSETYAVCVVCHEVLNLHPERRRDEYADDSGL